MANVKTELFLQISQCRRCPRLVSYQSRMKSEHPDFHCAPVRPWGAGQPRLMVVGLAPGLRGAGRNGKGFVGDASGAFLFSSLYRFGFASSEHAEAAKLKDTVITNIVKCLPPNNRPLGSERKSCEPFLVQELADFAPGTRSKNRVILCLGKDALDTVARLVCVDRPAFVHGGHYPLAGNYHLVSSYHPSRLNVNTGRLTRKMFDTVFKDIRTLLG